MELLSDLDSMAINLKIAGQQQRDSPFVYLEHLIIDTQNMTGFKYSSKLKPDFKVVRTKNNDRSRARRTERKGNGFDFNFLKSTDDNFAKEAGEYGRIWKKKYNNGKLSTPRQVFSGLNEFFRMQLD